MVEHVHTIVIGAALWSPATGIVDTHGFMLACQGDMERAGGLLALCTGFVGARRNGTHWRVRTRGEEGEYELLCTHLVNAAGLQAQRVAARIEGLDERHVPLALWLKGNYFSVSGVRPTTRSTRSARRSSMPPSAPTGQTCPTAPCSPPTAASGLSSPGAGCQ